MDPLQSDARSVLSASPFLRLNRSDSRGSLKYQEFSETPASSNTTIYHQVEIRSRDSFKFFVRADEPLENLHFSFYTRKKSIGFGLFYLYIPTLSNGASDDKDGCGSNLPIDKVKELIGASKENVRIQKMGQEGSLGRTFSTSKNSNLLNIPPSTSASTENFVEGLNSSPQLSSANLAQLKNSQTLKIGELIEVIPIMKYNSFEYTLEGSYTIPLTGTYVLLFDNSFSLNTSKHLFYQAYLSNDIVPSLSATPQLLSSGQVGSLCAAGWLSKRRSGVVRNWSRRWFQLDSLGVLSYFGDRASPLRGSIFVPDCSLIIAKNSFKFSLDSGSQTFHLQAYKREEFDFWIQVLSSFKHFGPPTTFNSNHKLPSTDNKISVRSRLDEAFKYVRTRLDSLRIRSKSSQDEEMSETIMKMESIYQILQKTREQLNSKMAGVEEEENETYSDVFDFEKGSNTEEYDEVFYDVQEIYVDDIDDDRMTTTSAGEVTEADALLEPEIGRILGQDSLSTTDEHVKVKRNAFDWLLQADLSLPCDDSPIYRINMPFPAPPINISFASVIMRKSFPVALNEPINLLQRLAEELEYSELLDKASGLNNDPIEQMVYMAAFAVSGYASAIHRSERKPYNPVLGETFEYIRPDKGFRFISEKVSHQPVIVACHAESRKWRFWQDVQAETKLWGKSMLISPKGKIHIDLLDESSEQTGASNSFSWCKVSGALRNVYSAKKSIENYGKLVIKNRAAGLEARIIFKESGIFSNSGNEIQGGIYQTNQSESSGPLVRLSGRWDDMLCKEVGSIEKTGSSDNLLQVIWKANPLPINYAQFFYLTSYAVTLNDFPDLLKKVLPITDSRHRTDQRMLESGMVDAADLEKQRIEQLQRDRRNSAHPIKSLWFDYDELHQCWKYNGKYWDERRANFTKVKAPQLW